MGRVKMLRGVIAVVACAAVTAVAQFSAFVDDFAGPALNTRWGTVTGSTWSGADGNTAPGCLRIDARSAAVAVSCNLYSGRGFTAGPVAVSFYMKDSLGGATIEIHLDCATSCGACGWWDYRSQAGYVNSAFSSAWELTVDEMIPDLGAIPGQWGGTMRSAVVDGLAADAQCPGSDTLDCNAVLIWRINIGSGVVLFDDWTQSVQTGVKPQKSDRAGWKRVTLSPNGMFPKATNYTVTVLDANGQTVKTSEAFGNTVVAPEGLAAGSYVMKVSSEFGNVTKKLVIPR